ncbi:DUF5134 domain-containing protein [Nonomuraea mangrovi]|uniref:DUF5134 domain-containing protein n=1 Tax=Nonomuraea mangrovi TaxID=2316207 RepID=A0ABW4SXK2_9ACTN
MTSADVPRVALTVVFVLVTAWFVVTSGRRRGVASAREAPARGTGGVCDVAHATMAAGMAVMVWPWEVVPSWLQGLVFAIVALWFLMLAASPDVAHRAVAGDHPMEAGMRGTSRRLANLHHASMAVAMTWMIVTLHGHAEGVAAIPHHAAVGAAGAVLVAPPPPHGVVAALAGYFVLAAVPWLAGAVRRRRAHRLCHAALSAGMGVMLLLA